MLLFCVRVSCEDHVLYGPKWVAVEEGRTLCDLLRCATGDRYENRKFRVVVSSEKSLRDFSFVKLGLPIKVLDKNDKRVVSFLLKDERPVLPVSHIFCTIITFCCLVHLFSNMFTVSATQTYSTYSFCLPPYYFVPSCFSPVILVNSEINSNMGQLLECTNVQINAFWYLPLAASADYILFGSNS